MLERRVRIQIIVLTHTAIMNYVSLPQELKTISITKELAPTSRTRPTTPINSSMRWVLSKWRCLPHTLQVCIRLA